MITSNGEKVIIYVVPANMHRENDDVSMLHKVKESQVMNSCQRRFLFSSLLCAAGEEETDVSPNS